MTDDRSSLYPIAVRPLSLADGGGWLAEVPDLPGCMSDGDTPEQAIAHVQDAVRSWLLTAQELGRVVPDPSPDMATAIRRLDNAA